MIGLLTAIAAIATITLLVSAVATGDRATTGDKMHRGPWGILHWSRDRSRPLNPHERRWQTALLSGKENASRWPDLVSEIQTLERLSGVDAITKAVPASYDVSWLRASISNLESSITPPSRSATPSGETTQ